MFLRAHLAVDLEEAREHIRTRAPACRRDRSELTSFAISASSIGKSRTRNFFGNSLNQNCAVASVPARLRAYTIGVTFVRQVPRIREHREALLRMRPGSGKLRKVYLPTFTPASVHDPAGRHHRQFHAALIDVVLRVVGRHARRRQHTFTSADAVSVCAREVVGDRLHHDPRVAFLQIRRLVLAGLERHGLRRLIAPPDEAGATGRLASSSG